MKGIFTLIFSTLISASSLASNQDLFDIMDLADQVKLAARTTTVSDADLQDAKYQLKQVLALLNNTNSNPSPNTDCINYTYSKYYMSYSSETATQKAVDACKRIADLDTAKFLFDKYYMTLSVANAMDEATNRSGKPKIGKSDMLSFMFEKYYTTLSARSAADRASDAVDLIRRGQLSCLQSLYSKYYQSMASNQAMDRAAVDCR